MLKHKGEILEKIINESKVPINRIAKKLDVNRSTIYRMFGKPDVPAELILKIGKIIDVDMTKYFPETLQLAIEPPLNYNPPKSYDELLNESKYWKDKYIDILEKYNNLLNEQLTVAKSTVVDHDKRSAG